MRMEKIDGYVFPFILASALTLVGLGGLALQLRKKVDAGAGDDHGDRELHVYKSHPFELNAALCQRLIDETEGARKQLDERQIAVDEVNLAKLREAAEAKTKAADWPAAFRARAQLLQYLAQLLAKHHYKDEAFKPNWTTPHRAMGG